MSLRGNLSSLKAKLKDISAQLEEQESGKLIKEQKQKNIDEKIGEIKDVNRKIVNINVGGKNFSTVKSVLTKDPNSIFAILLNEDASISELFFDRSPRLFNVLLDYLRFGKIDYKKFRKEDLEELYAEALFYEITDIRDYLCERTKEITPVNMTFSGEYIFNGKVIGENDVKNLTDKEMKKGICCKSPGWVEFELNSNWEFQVIKLAGYQGNKTAWYPGNGCGAQIHISENGKDYKKVGHIPSKFAKEITEIKLDSVVTAKYVKITHSSYLGLGYFYIEKEEN